MNSAPWGHGLAWAGFAFLAIQHLWYTDEHFGTQLDG